MKPSNVKSLPHNTHYVVVKRRMLMFNIDESNDKWIAIWGKYVMITSIICIIIGSLFFIIGCAESLQ